MSVKIYKFSKRDLSDIDDIDVYLANTISMTISHYACAYKSTQVTLPFIIEGVNKFIPYIKDVDFCVVIRKKINLTATGVNEKIITDIGKDVGKYKYVDNVPSRPLDLPPGFKELYKAKEK